jgi:hypothetical protein
MHAQPEAFLTVDRGLESTADDSGRGDEEHQCQHDFQ